MKYGCSASIGAFALMAFANSCSAAEQSLTVATFGGVWGEAYNECYLKPFSAQTGISTINESSTSVTTLAKLERQRTAPPYDVAFMNGGVSELANHAGVVAPLDPDRIPSLRELVPQALHTRGDGKVYAATHGFYSMGLFYNTREAKGPLKSWQDLWSRDFENKIVFPSPANYFGLFPYLNKLFGGTIDDPSNGAEKIKQLRVLSFYDSSGIAQASIQSGEAIAGAWYNNATWTLADQGVPIIFVVPAEGAAGGDDRIHLVEGSAKKDAAEKLINYVLSKPASECIAKRLYLGPANKNAVLDDKTKSRMPWGANGSVADLAIPDWEEVLRQRDAYLSAWNRTVLGR